MDGIHGYPGGGPQNGRAISPEELDRLMANAGTTPLIEEDWMAPAKPELAIAKAFWTAFSPDDLAIRLRLLKHDKSAPPREVDASSVDEAWPHVVEFQARGYEVYYFLNRVARGNGRGWGGAATDDDVPSIRALATDHDDGLPDVWHLEPSFVIHSSAGKGQAIWPVSDCPVDGFENAQQRLIAQYNSDESITNPSRILRLPGTLHQKDPNDPQLVTFKHNSAAPVARPLRTLTEGLPEAKPRKQKAAEPREDRREVDPALLLELLPFIDPCGSRKAWCRILSAIKNTTFVGKDDAWNAEMACRWSAGEFWKGDDPATVLGTDGKPKYQGEDDVEKAFNSNLYLASFGSIVWHARAAGWNGNVPWEPIVFPNPPGTAPGRDKRINLLSVGEIFAMPDPTELVEGLLMERENTALVGEPKCGKTFVALEIALSIAADVMVLGSRKVCRSGKVVYLSGEGHGGMKRRIRAWLATHNLKKESISGRFFYNANVPMTQGGIEECQAYIEAIQAKEGMPALVVIDTMARSLGGLDENASNSATLYLDMTEVLRRSLKCTVLTLAHASNKPQARKDGKVDIRGSSGFAAGFDAVWTAQKNEVNGCVKIAPRWLKDADEEDMRPLFFQLEKISLGEGEKRGAVLKPVNPAMFDQGISFPEKGQTVDPQESAAAIMRILQEGDHHDFHNGLTHRLLAERIIPAAAKTEEAQRLRSTAVAKCAHRLRNRRDKKGLGSEEIPSFSGTALEWRWWHLPT
jgi:hypothetical protein